MHPPASAYHALGLEPGAPSEAVERAYRQLIKRHHPDLPGGCQQRAAEINQAYHQLRRLGRVEPTSQPQGGRHLPVSLHARRRQQRRRHHGRGRFWAGALAGAAAASAALFVPAFSADVAEGLRSAQRLLEPTIEGLPQSRRLGSLEDPLFSAEIAASADTAAMLAADNHRGELAERSRACHQALRAAPAVRLLDRCAALDFAAAALLAASGEASIGRFAASAVTTRQMTAGSLFSNDYLAIERRLDRVRIAVDMRLAPSPPPPRAVRLSVAAGA